MTTHIAHRPLSMEMETQVRDRRPDALGSLQVLPDDLLCAVLDLLPASDIARLSCVSSVMYILCNEEPLWLSLCIRDGGPITYKGSWKKTFLYRQNISTDSSEASIKQLRFDGFSSLFLYRRWYRCFTVLSTFSFDSDVLERKKIMSLEEFHSEYDAQKPVLLTELVNSWPAKNSWTIVQLLEKYGHLAFRISQRSSKKITMKFSDYVSYMEVQHDEDPLYIFDDEFGEIAPGLLEDYNIPHLFKEDFFDVLDHEQRPPFRWLIIGPERSGASWHVDPGLTSAWNTLLTGRKRWALYPPGRVPPGVTVHVSEEDDDVNIDTPSSLQWWLDVYPLLLDEDRPLECTQLPGETIFVPSGWWHCVLNLEVTIAVTQNFVNASNFEFVCLDLAPGHVHKGVSRAGLLAVPDVKRNTCKRDEDHCSQNYQQTKRFKTISNGEPFKCANIASVPCDVNISFEDEKFSYDCKYLSKFLDPERNHYTSSWGYNNYMGQRELRSWLHKLWILKPDIRQLIWKGACYALNIEKWSACMLQICASHNLPLPSEKERFPVGTGSNPVYVIDDYVIKFFVEGGLEFSLLSLGTELQFYRLLCETESPIQKHIPQPLASGIIVQDCNGYKTWPWDGKTLPNLPTCDKTFRHLKDDISFMVWTKQLLGCSKVVDVPSSTAWTYLIIRRCKGDIFANLRDIMSNDDVLSLASFLGCQLKELHLLPVPKLYSAKDLMINVMDPKRALNVESKLSHLGYSLALPAEYEILIAALDKRRKGLSDRLHNWGSSIPKYLIEKVQDYIPDDISWILNIIKDRDGHYRVSGPLTWLHMDIMDDNIIMEPCLHSNSSEETFAEHWKKNNRFNGSVGEECSKKWCPSHILDFSDLMIGDPLCDLIPIYLDVFRGDASLLDKLLASYELPLLGTHLDRIGSQTKFNRLSYRAMCYCLLHEDNVVGTIFSLWKHLKSALTWEEVEETVWGSLNKYCSTK